MKYQDEVGGLIKTRKTKMRSDDSRQDKKQNRKAQQRVVLNNKRGYDD